MNNSPATLHFFCGKAGAGKSTLAARLARDLRVMLLSEDVWLSRLYGDQMKTFDDYVRFSGRLKTVVGPLVSELLASGQSVILDFQANTRSRRSWLLSVAAASNAQHVLHFVDATDEVCLAQIAKRNSELPEGSHPLTEQVFRYVTSLFEPPVEEGLNIKIYAQTGPSGAA